MTPSKKLASEVLKLVDKAKKSNDSKDAWAVVDFLYDFPNALCESASMNEAANLKGELKAKINRIAVALNKNGKDGPSSFNKYNLRELALSIAQYRTDYDSNAFQMYIDMINRRSESWSTPTYEDYRKQYANKLNESIYYVSGSTPTGEGDADSTNSGKITDPAKAIEQWFKIGAKHRTGTAITATKKSDAIALVTWADKNQDKITEWHKKYGCPYKLDFLLKAISDQVRRKCSSFYESEYGDMVYPFDVG